MVTEIGEKRIGFVVDKVIGQHQTVIKNLGKLLSHIDGISGATIMGTGPWPSSWIFPGSSSRQR